MHFSRKKIVDLVLVFMLFVFLGILVYLYIPNINFSINNFFANKYSSKVDYKNPDAGDNVNEIYITPIPVTNNLNIVSTLLSTSDLTVGYIDKSENLSADFIKQFIKDKNINLMFSKNNDVQMFSNLGVNYCSSSSYFQANYEGKRINFLYIDVDDESSDNFNRFINTIQDLKKSKFPIIVYIDSSKPLKDEYTDFLAKTGVNLVLISSYDKYKFKLIGKTLFVNNCNNTENSYVPQFSFIFYKNNSVSIGLKLIVTDYEKKDAVIKDLNDRSYNIPFKISEKYNFIDY